MKGWEIAGDETLGMSVVSDDECPLQGSVPAPRVLQNQLDRKLECYIVDKERELLKAVQRAFRKGGSEQRNTISSAVIVVLHVLERDTWRLMYWTNRCEKVSFPMESVRLPTDWNQRYQWRHPSKPETLIEKNAHLANLLLTHLRCAGNLPDALRGLLVDALGRGHPQYDRSDESSLDGCLSLLLLKPQTPTLISAEKLISSSACA